VAARKPSRPPSPPRISSAAVGTQAGGDAHLGVHHRPVKLMECSMLLPGIATARGIVINRHCRTASGEQSLRNSTGRFCASPCQITLNFGGSLLAFGVRQCGSIVTFGVYQQIQAGDHFIPEQPGNHRDHVQ
jgi:hypothetical protein